jgi:hypothetical protein
LLDSKAQATGSNAARGEIRGIIERGEAVESTAWFRKKLFRK